MSKLHVFIDGSWFYKVVEGTVFDRFLAQPHFFELDFSKLNALMLKHIREHRPDCTEIGNCYFVTSIFELPQDIDTWVGRTITSDDNCQTIQVTQQNIEIIKNSVRKRKEFAQSAVVAGYKQSGILQVRFQEWMLLNLVHTNLRYQEKQVDTTVVALLVKEAIEHGNDSFALVAGDADILPAINIAYPSYTRNVFPVLTSPDEREGRNRQTAYKYSQYSFDIPTLILQNHVADFMKGNVYQCTDCHKYFTTLRPIPQTRLSSGATLPRCPICRP